MSLLKVMAPVRSLRMLEEMIESGVDEVYIGLKPQGLDQLSFDNRFQTIAGYPAHCPDIETLGRIIDTAHENGIAVNYMANARFVPRGFESGYLDHIRKGLDRGVDCVTVSNLQEIALMQNAGLEIPLMAGTGMAVANAGHLKLMKTLGVKRIVLPQFLKLEEIASLRDSGMEMFITGNFTTGGIPGSCRLWESPYSSEIGDGTRTLYEMTGFAGQENPILDSPLDAGLDCSLCSLGDLVRAGVSGIRLIGREAPNPVTMAMVIDLFKSWIDMEGEGFSADRKKQIMEADSIMWVMKWAPRFCNNARCSYLQTRTQASMI